MKLGRQRVGQVLRHPLGGSVAFLLVFYLALELLIPVFGGWLASDSWFSLRPGLTSTGRETGLYLALAVFACLCYLTYNEERWQRFQRPIWDLMRWRHPGRTIVLVATPLVVGALLFLGGALGGSEPVANPIKHPTPPDDFSKLSNPFRDPTAEMLELFDQEISGGAIESAEDVVVAYAEELAQGRATHEDRRLAFERRTIEEGRELFMINCRPCHGARAMGDGPMSVGQRREPADFTGVETIATLVEGAVFWRIRKGGIGLPREGAPWESAMPRWETDLEDEEIWKIIMAEYDLAGNAPRVSEKLEKRGETVESHD